MLAEEMRETNAKVASMEQEMKVKDSTFEKKIKDMNDTFGKELRKLERELDARDASNAKLEREVSFLKEPPFSFFCGYRYELTNITSATITYDYLLYSSTSIPDMASMDTQTGIFTSGWVGTYTINWSLYAYDTAGDHHVSIYLR